MPLVDEHVAADELLTTEDAARLLGISAGALRRYAWLGTIPSVKFGRAPNAHRFFERRVIQAARAGGIDALDELRHANGNGGTP
jgi:excisionase family DNA binding protein